MMGGRWDGQMTATSTNLHFHGLTIPAACHKDEVLTTSIQPQDSPFQYRFRIPANEPPRVETASTPRWLLRSGSSKTR